MARPESGRWLKWFGRADGALRLFCFHHAGGTASMYREWPRWLPESIAPVAVQLPGRADRFLEPPFDTMAPLIEALIEALAPELGEPFAFYGLSMGARVSWALTHAMRERGMPLPVALYLASAAAPSWGEGWCNPAMREDDDYLLGYLREMGGTPTEVFTEPELLAHLLPTLRADLTLVDTFQYRPPAPLDVPIHAFAGRDDVEGPAERMSGWREETRGRFGLDVVSGGHFFDAAGELQMIQTITSDLLRGLGTGRGTAMAPGNLGIRSTTNGALDHA